MLESLKQQGIRLALASSNGLSIVEKSLRITAYAPLTYFGVWWWSWRASGGKPDPEFICTRLPAAWGLGPAALSGGGGIPTTAGIWQHTWHGMRSPRWCDDRFGFDRSLADYGCKRISDILQLYQAENGCKRLDMINKG